ncbi:MAG: GNAT family N-acetyltransferase [Lachnospirales bacterium]
MLRKFEVEDINRVMKIWLESNLEAHSFVKAEYWYSNEKTVRALMLESEIYVFEKNDILGFVGMEKEYLAGIFVEKKYRDMGIGKLLLDYIKNIREKFTLNVFKENTGAVNFYLREGLNIISEEVDEATNKVAYLMEWKKED